MVTAQIALLGKEALPVYYAIKEFAPEKVFLIATNENQEIATRIQSVCGNLPCQICMVDAYDPAQVVKVCEKIHSESSYEAYLYNLTGGTKVMSLAAFSIAVKYGAETIYTTQANEIIDFRTLQISPMNCSLTNNEIFALQGQKVKDFAILDRHDKSRVSCALEIKEFIEANYKVYDKLSRSYVKENRILPKALHLTDNITLSKTGHDIVIEKDDIELLQVSHTEAVQLLFEGRWWEALVADALLSWSETLEHPYEIWLNVKFAPMSENVKQDKKENNDKNDKNEVDILINIGTKFMFIECKSGNITQNDIYKVAAVRNTYGSGMSKAVLASYHPLDALIKEKAKELDIRLFAPQRYDQRPDYLKRNAGAVFGKIMKQLNI